MRDIEDGRFRCALGYEEAWPSLDEVALDIPALSVSRVARAVLLHGVLCLGNLIINCMVDWEEMKFLRKP